MRRILFALAASTALALPARGDEARLDQLFGELAGAAPGRWETVEEAIWSELSQSGSPSLDFLLLRGRMALADGDYEAAIEHLTALTDAAPGFAEGWNSRATAFYEAGNYGLALGDIARVLALEPRHFGALGGLGLIYEATGDEDGALAAYRAALAIHPQRPDLREAVQRLEADLRGTDI